MPKHAPYIFRFVLAVATPHEDLRTGTKSEDEHKHGNEEDTAERRCTQLHFAHTSQEGRVGHANQLLNDGAEQKGEYNFPNVAIGITRSVASTVRWRDSFVHFHIAPQIYALRQTSARDDWKKSYLCALNIPSAHETLLSRHRHLIGHPTNGLLLRRVHIF